MAAGRKAAPVALKVLKGDGRGRDSGGRKIKAGQRFTRFAPQKPDDLSELASQHWDLVVDELQRLEVLKPIDAGALVILCETWARWKTSETIYRQEGLTKLTSQGLGAHPAVGIAERAGREYRAFAAEFGLTPAAESKLGGKQGPSGDDENPFQ